MTRLTAVEEKWRARWREAGAHSPILDPAREKFFTTFPYGYMNGQAHLGHAYTTLRNDLMARYQRMRGKNVLFPFAYHVTGTPIVAAANRVREGEPKQLQILRDMGVPDADLPKFADPVHWVRHFPKQWREDIERYGLMVDWTREFHTSELDPAYDAFIRWQFRRLRAQGLVEKGRHPVIWCPKDQAPVADHDRAEGEGETPQEFTLVKFRLNMAGQDGGDLPGMLLVAATLRPETMYGQTNVWIDPRLTYSWVRVGKENWIVSRECVEKLKLQFGDVERLGGIPGRDLVGSRVWAPAREAAIPVLPADFIDPAKGTGVVTSVPSDAPDDWAALRDLQRDEGRMRELGLDPVKVRAIEPIPIIVTKGWGPLPAVEIVERMGIESQKDRARLDAAKEEVYKAGFYDGVMAATAKQFAGKPVEVAKEEIKQKLLAEGHAALLYEPTGPVVCRCLTPAVVKIVSDQWFMRYGDPSWKARTHEAIDRMDILPPIARKQFHHVVDWLRDWACARESGIGTRIPWDERWLIESLSDSTIYMSYYTIAHLVEPSWVTSRPSDAEIAHAYGDARAPPGGRSTVDPRDLTDAFFDHVLLGEGSAEAATRGSVTPALVHEARRQFQYWYPVDFRNSGKDLLQNHLTFFVFNHVAIWRDDPSRWPRGIGVNGWVTVDGEKMAKSKGNFLTLREAIDRWGASATRLALANAGEGLDDANFEREFAEAADRRIEAWLESIASPPRLRRDRLGVDAAWRSTLHRLLAAAKSAMDAAEFRSALKIAWFDIPREFSWYVRRSGGSPHEDLWRETTDAQVRILTPFVPHVAEEAHERLGKKGIAIDAPWPDPEPSALAPDAEAAERFVRDTLDDAKEILKIVKAQPKEVALVIAPSWKRRLHDAAMDLARRGELKMPVLMAAAMADPALKQHAKDAPKAAQDLIKALANLGAEDTAYRAAAFDEAAVLREAAAFLAAEIGAPVTVHEADSPTTLPQGAEGKARAAMPRRPAIFVAS
ncbi:MAG TPA: leucine--tRNA ligase [Candidatus Thermoplasmatota archaeon]|nr:leucine--tRNA ligase [Candidatus Thermoplasmatota archaeon]